MNEKENSGEKSDTYLRNQHFKYSNVDGIRETGS